MNNTKKCPCDFCGSENLTFISKDADICNDCGYLFNEKEYYPSSSCDLYEIFLYDPAVPPIFILINFEESCSYYRWWDSNDFCEIYSDKWMLYHVARNGYPFDKWKKLYYQLKNHRQFVRQKDLALIQKIERFVEGKPIINDDDAQDLDDIPF